MILCDTAWIRVMQSIHARRSQATQSTSATPWHFSQGGQLVATISTLEGTTLNIKSRISSLYCTPVINKLNQRLSFDILWLEMDTKFVLQTAFQIHLVQSRLSRLIKTTFFFLWEFQSEPKKHQIQDTISHQMKALIIRGRLFPSSCLTGITNPVWSLVAQEDLILAGQMLRPHFDGDPTNIIIENILRDFLHCC